MADSQSVKVISHLRTKWGARPCPMCGAQNWNVSDTVFELRQFHGGNLVLGQGPIIPIIPVTCVNCGNTIFINGIITGIIENEKKENQNG